MLHQWIPWTLGSLTAGLVLLRFRRRTKTTKTLDVGLKAVAGATLLARLWSQPEGSVPLALWLATVEAIGGDLILATHEDADGRSMTLGTFCFDVCHGFRAMHIAPNVAPYFWYVSTIPRALGFGTAYHTAKPTLAFAVYAFDMLALLSVSSTYGTTEDLWAAIAFSAADLGILADVWGHTLPSGIEHGVWALPLYYAGHWWSTVPLFEWNQATQIGGV